METGLLAGTAASSLERGAGLKWFERQELGASRGDPNANFGYSVAFAEEVVVVGAPSEDVDPESPGGAAYVFERSGTEFEERQHLTASQSAAGGDDFGAGLAISGSTIFVRAPRRGTTHVFARQNGAWHEQQTLVGSRGNELSGPIAAVENAVIVGTPVEQTAHIFEPSAGGWIETQTLNAIPDKWWLYFGAAVALSERWAVVASPVGERALTANGIVYAFDRRAVDAPPHLLRASDGLDPDPQGPGLQSFGNDAFGTAVAIFDDTIFVAAPTKEHDAGGLGVVYVFEWMGSTWTEKAKLTRSVMSHTDWFGGSLAALDGMLLAGAANGNAGSVRFPGLTEIFVKTQGTWGERPHQTFFLRQGESFQEFGVVVAASGSTAVIGAPGREDGGAAFIAELRLENSSPCAHDAECGSEHCSSSGTCCDRSCGPCGDCSNGTCVVRGAEISGMPACWPYVCTGSDDLCPESCSRKSECAPGYYCGGAECAPQLGDRARCRTAEQCRSEQCVDGYCRGTSKSGEACSEDAQCDTGHCVDGVCCDEACRGQCEACDLPETRGTCSAVSPAPRGDRPPCTGDSAPCRGECNGSERNTCVYATSATPCGSSCSNARQTDSVCNGSGECVLASEYPCNNLVCADDARCKLECETHTDCVSGFTCDGGQCVPRASCSNENDHTVYGTNGVSQNCSPYRCVKGRCNTACGDEDDCAFPYLCHQKRCIPPEISPGASGCAHAPARDHRSTSSWTAIVLAIGTLSFGCTRRRRRAK